ncbi:MULTISPECIES: hypothetical protein [unclassified Nocardioides]|uniref:hypothetical protein n=1 Tax=unclassified Nocardioides TaxID=2615069 RepID=UPI0009F0ADA4|nr:MULTISPECIES: hypothetical protein [unclassified Nocardioides]GAW52583.1 hypothetical protein PD653B2_4941 [Nocardioides sp. PD653-B2]GAW57594.1 hypothetical protein PD653_5039 [Nocardioides sp. PD653]
MVGAVLDTVLGLAFVFALVSLMVTACVEAISTVTKKRAKYLLRGILQLFEDAHDPDAATGWSTKAERRLYQDVLDGRTSLAPPRSFTRQWVVDVMNHPLVLPLGQRSAKATRTVRVPPSISARQFALALIDRICPGAKDVSLDDIKDAVQHRHMPAQLRRALRALVKTLPQGDADQLREAIESWFDAQMAAVGDSYRRWAKRWAVVIGLVVAAALNVSALTVAHALYVDEPLREATVAAATNGEVCHQEDTPQALQKCLQSLDDEGLPIGWGPPTMRGVSIWHWAGDRATDAWAALGTWPAWMRLFGWILTGLAASFGASFWFDALKRLTGARKLLVSKEVAP